ncbi:MAG: NAD(+) synthase, partial [Nanoarchaeota archaeon]|nr:NAD(+) synthase [Nanoarchaeota archaeon]
PTAYNSTKTKQAAALIAENLGIDYVEIPIEDMVDVNKRLLESLKTDGDARLTDIGEENVQAKIRGTSILSNLAAKRGAIFTNNGNKLETALGYATLYGDVGGAFAPIGDLTKEEVFEMGKYLNREVFRREVIPGILFPDRLFRFTEDQIEPSAELKDNQVDPMRFGYHCALLKAFTDYKKKTPEQIMRWYIEGSMEKMLGISTDLIRRWGIDNPQEFVNDLEWFDRSIQRNVFKRIQSPPIIITSKSAYGYDIRESMLPYRQSKEYLELKQEILGMERYKTKE